MNKIKILKSGLKNSYLKTTETENLMMFSNLNLKFIFLVGFLICMAYPIYPIECFNCQNDWECNDPFFRPERFLTNCTNNETFCEKVVYFGVKNSVTRRCAESCTEYTKIEEDNVITHHCCTSERCNENIESSSQIEQKSQADNKQSSDLKSKLETQRKSQLNKIKHELSTIKEVVQSSLPEEERRKLMSKQDQQFKNIQNTLSELVP
ncbi:unnamed protein product [Brachionus calyciflorus]|uniref:Snake toxin/toxin-like domain-containing protein n=1 Tax=Brachionus calyciflorus TaxID=104777 RepID=A0A814BKY7_9BILA|nr:unnamed protein product [Brachionus calyciflorus]